MIRKEWDKLTNFSTLSVPLWQIPSTFCEGIRFLERIECANWRSFSTNQVQRQTMQYKTYHIPEQATAKIPIKSKGHKTFVILHEVASLRKAITLGKCRVFTINPRISGCQSFRCFTLVFNWLIKALKGFLYCENLGGAFWEKKNCDIEKHLLFFQQTNNKSKSNAFCSFCLQNVIRQSNVLKHFVRFWINCVKRCESFTGNRFYARAQLKVNNQFQ